MRQATGHGSSAVVRLTSFFAIAAMLLMAIPFAAQPAPVEAHHTDIKWPFAAGATWYISQGYNTSPAEGWSHYNCDPTSLKDAISQSRSCSQYYQYKYSFDVKRLDGNTAGQPVLAPVNGTIRWIDEAFGGMSINLSDGYAYAFFHANLVSGLAAGQSVQQGQLLGYVAPAGEGGNGGTPHIHITIWQTTDGGNWSRGAVPFTGAMGIDGYDFPALSESTKNQHWQRQIVSTNVQTSVGGASAPATPTHLSPATGTTYTTTGVRPTLTWNSVTGATEYQIVVNDGAQTSPWLSTTSWQMPALANGQYAWQIRARNGAGQSNLSPKWVFWVDPPAGTATPTPTPTAAGTPGALGLTLNKTSTSVNGDVTATGSGFNPNEQVSLFLDSATSTAFATATAAGNGAFTSTFPMPAATGGNHTIIAKGNSSNKQASASLSIASTLTRTPYQGPPGTSIAVTVYGFGANEQVRLSFDTTSGTVLGTATTNANGTGSVNVTMPEASSGWHDYVGTGLTSRRTAWGALFVERKVLLSASSGDPGSSVTVNASGFPASEAVTVAWNKSGTSVCTGTLTTKGSYSCTFTVPEAIAGSYPIVVTSASGSSTTATYALSGPAGVAISPTSGAVFSNVTVTGGGFGANEQVRLNWNNSSTAWATTTADAAGNFRWLGTIPTLSTGTNTLNARGLSSNTARSTTFQVTATGGNSGTLMIAPGTYRITATIEGLVGFTTSNGHLITPFDHFVALPACTESSCPWLTPGGSTYVAACGDNCYVRVVNPVTNQCSVAPVWDVGPWFTNDNWWDPAGSRVINTRSGAVNQLAQGYPAAEAARNGLDVGYGTSGGIGISNKAYIVGNRAAMDIADGTWVDIGLAQSAGIATVVVTMLWQTGEDPDVAAAACGQQTGPLVDVNPVSGPAGSDVTVTGSGFDGGERINIHLDSSSTPALKTITASNTGTFSTTVRIPAGTSTGEHRLHGVGQSSKRRDGVTFTVIVPATPTPTPVAKPAITIDRTSGAPGVSVTVSGTGYGANEKVRIYLDSQKTPNLVEAQTNGSGTFSTNVVIPETSGGAHRLHAIGFTSRLRAARTFTVTPAASLSRSSGVARQTLTVTLDNFGASERVEFRWAGEGSASGSTTVDQFGNGSFSVKAPWTNGTFTGTLTGVTSGLQVSLSFTVNEKIKLTPNQGEPGTQIAIRGTGFAPATTVNVYWNNVRSSNLLCTKRTSSTYGTFDCTVTPPAGASAGNHLLVAVSGGLSATATFKLGGNVAAEVPSPTETPPATQTPVPNETTTPDATATPEVTATATPEQTAVPTEEPTPPPAPEPVEQEIVLLPIADTSVNAGAPDVPQPPETVGELSIGGDPRSVTLVTFDVSGLPEGSVVSATLVLTGSGTTSGAAGRARVLLGYAVDEWGGTYASIPASDAANARGAGGSPATIDWIDPGVEVAVDVTGTVNANGTVTFVLAGTAEAAVSIASRESAAPPRLVIRYLAPPSG